MYTNLVKNVRVSYRGKRHVPTCVITYLIYTLLALMGMPAGVLASKPNMQHTTCETSPIFTAIQNRDISTALKIIDSKLDPERKNCDGATPLLESIVYDEFDVSERLIRLGANPNGTDDLGVSPLMMAGFYCRQKVVPILLAHGAMLNVVDSDGFSPLMQSLQNCPDGGIAAVLIRSGADVNIQATNGDTALTVATFYGNEDAVHVLIAAGANLATETKEGETAVAIARDRNVGRTSSHDRIYEFLRQLVLLDQMRTTIRK